MITLRDYQVEKRDESIQILRNRGIVYLAGEVRVGKTLIALSVVNELKYSRCLFLTKKLAIGSIMEDYEKSGYKFFLKVTNYEQLHNEHSDYDIVIYDEVHSVGAMYPKPSKKAKLAKQLFYEKPAILMTGTPNPESFSQLYHQFWISIYSPWHEYKSFYKWAKKYVNVWQRMINGYRVNDYKNGIEELIKPDIKPFMVHISQKQAGFESFVEETVLIVNMNPNIYKLIEKLKKDKIYQLKNGEHIIADTPTRALTTFHQICSGTIKTEEGGRFILDRSKADFIKEKFKGQKIAIFSKYIAEEKLLKKTFPNHTNNPQEFQKRDDLVFIRQIISGREGINLSSADAIVLYNIDYSATSYIQVRARMQTKTRTKASSLYWIFSDKGIESKIYSVVKNKKKNYTSYYFKRDYIKK